jgi:hypothetical protein
MKDGNIDTWWSYEQFAKRGMEPALRFIENVGVRMEKLRERLQAVKADILQSSINNQTEATRDNTHKLERIQDTLVRIAEATEKEKQQAAKMESLNYLFQIFYILIVVILTVAAAPTLRDAVNNLWKIIFP